MGGAIQLPPLEVCMNMATDTGERATEAVIHGVPVELLANEKIKELHLSQDGWYRDFTARCRGCNKAPWRHTYMGSVICCPTCGEVVAQDVDAANRLFKPIVVYSN